MRRPRVYPVLFGVAAGLATVSAIRAADAPLALICSVELPRVEGRIDHLAFDSSSGRLFVAALGNNTVEIVDTASAVRARTIPGLHEPQGIAVVPGADLVVIANGEGEGLDLFTAGDLRPIRTVRLGEDADNVRYDPSTRRLYVGFGAGAIAMATGLEAGSVPIVGDTDDLFYDTVRHRVYVTGGEGDIDVLQIDAANRLTRIARVETASGARTSLWIPERNRLYVAVPHRGNQRAEIREYEAR